MSRKKRRRLPKHRKKEPIFIECHNCGYEWAPQPFRWRDWSNPIKMNNMAKRGRKALSCPDCSTKIRIGGKLLLEILRRNKNVGTSRSSDT